VAVVDIDFEIGKIQISNLPFHDFEIENLGPSLPPF